MAGVAIVAGIGWTGCAGFNDSSQLEGPPLTGSSIAITPLAHGAAGLTRVPFSRGRSEFAPGDVILIREVLATTPHIGVGDTVVVRGEYQLSSEPAAVLALYVTGAGQARSSGTQKITVTKGSGEFELSCEIAYAGALHVSFYPTQDGNALGGVYFGPTL